MSTQTPFDPNAYELPNPLSRGDPVALMLASEQDVTQVQVPMCLNPEFQAHFANLLRNEILAGNEIAKALVSLWENIATASGVEITNQSDAFTAIEEFKQCSCDYITLLDGLNKLLTGVEGKPI